MFGQKKRNQEHIITALYSSQVFVKNNLIDESKGFKELGNLAEAEERLVEAEIADAFLDGMQAVMVAVLGSSRTRRIITNAFQAAFPYMDFDKIRKEADKEKY